jgi:hypothetical protein
MGFNDIPLEENSEPAITSEWRNLSRAAIPSLLILGNSTFHLNRTTAQVKTCYSTR